MSIVPAACYDICNSVYLEVQTIGKTPAICESDSSFLSGLAQCGACMDANDSSESIYVDPRFSQYIDFCTGEATKPSYASSLLTVVTRTQFTDVTGLNGSVESGVLRTVTVTELKAEATTTSMTPPTAMTSTLGTTDSMTTTSASPNEAATALEPPTPDPDPSPSKAWIAGPVVGGVCAIALLAGGIWFLRRRRKRRQEHPAGSLPMAAYEDDGKGKYEKAELHADGAPRPPPMELEGSYPDPVPEMGANEVPARELPAPDDRRVA